MRGTARGAWLVLACAWEGPAGSRPTGRIASLEVVRKMFNLAEACRLGKDGSDPCRLAPGDTAAVSCYRPRLNQSR